MPRNYVMQWNLNIQREITPSVTAFIGYVGSHGVHMPLRIDDYDIVLPTLTSAGYLWPKLDARGNVFSSVCNPLDPNGRRRSKLQSCVETKSEFRFHPRHVLLGQFIFHALEAGVTKNMTHGLQVQGSFTWSKSIDDSSGTGMPTSFRTPCPVSSISITGSFAGCLTSTSGEPWSSTESGKCQK